MAFDFPTAPVVNQVYAPAGGPVFVWNGAVWLLADQSGGSAAIASPFKRTGFTANNTTFQFDVSTLYADIEVQGGGGGGGGNTGSSAAGNAAAGGGGGGGGYVKKLIEITSAVRAAAKVINVGVGGNAGGAGPGGTGGTSGYNDTINVLSAAGGTGGIAGAQGVGMIPRYGGTGGQATGGDYNVYGSAGGNGFGAGTSIIGSAGFAAAMAGAGGNSHLGGGGVGYAIAQTNAAQGFAGENGWGYGGGGGGGCSINAVGSNAVGGAGYQGVVIITEYR